MNANKNYGFATKQVHAGNVKNETGSLGTPIYQTSTFQFDTVEQGGRRFAGEEPGYIYSRLSNPTADVLEAKIAALEGTEACIATASGMGAISAALWTSVKAGDHVLADETLYGCTFSLLSHGLSQFGVEVELVDFTNLDNVKNGIKANTKVIYFETPCNPTMKVIDIKGVCDIAHAANKDIKVIIDNTFCSPYIQRPVEHGADVVVHSATKYLNGHGDVIAGCICGTADFIAEVRGFGIKDMTGAVISPFNAWLMLRGLKTLDLRVERHSASAMALAEFLEGHPMVKKVNYPGLKSFEGYEVAKKQMDLFGGMLSFELNADKATTAKFINDMDLITIAVSLGDAETLVEHPATMTHSTYSAEELAQAGISEGLIRVSVGLENGEDIIAAFKEGLDKLM